MANAAKHFLYYPKNEPDIKPYLAFGFRPFFLIFPWYVVFMLMFWGLNYGGVISFLPFLDPLSWHIYELLYGLGFGALGAFLLTALPEFFPSEIPIVGKKLKAIVCLWIAARVGFWFMSGTFGIVLAMVANVAFSFVVLSIAFRPIVLDRLQRHSSIAYIAMAITIIQIMFFLSLLGIVEVEPIKWLYAALSFFISLVLLALRRIQTEEINQLMEESGKEERFRAKSFRYNLAIFCILSFCIAEFFMQNSVTGWLALSSFAATLGIMNDYKLNYETILIHPIIVFFAIILAFISMGYLLLGLSYFGLVNELNYARHMLGMGGFGGAIIIAMLIISFVHTGRKPKCDKWVLLIFTLFFAATMIRYFAAEFGVMVYLLSSLSFSGCFIVYFFRFKDYLLNKRADGLPG
jgi:uncharacterized protein involved in response to NO